MNDDSSAIAEAYRSDVHARFVQLRSTAESALRQTSDADFFRSLGASEDNSIAVIVKHMGGNLRSRFTDFLTSDGEKPDRDRDGEFLTIAGASRTDIEARWNAGWQVLTRTLESLTPADLLRTITIRGESMLVVQALGRSLAHMAQHAGQVVLLAKHLAGERWQTLSIPRGQSAAYDAALRDGTRDGR